MSENEQENESGAGTGPVPPPANFGVGPSDATVHFGAAGPADQQWPAAPPAFDGQPGQGFGPPADQLGGVQPRPRRKTGLLIGGAAAVAVAVIVAVVFAVGSGGSGGSGAQSAAQTIAAAQRNAAKINTATAIISEQVGGQTVISGTATLRRSPLLVAETITEQSNGESIPITEILTPSTLYLKSSGLIQGAAKPWIEIPLARLGAASVFATLLHNAQNENPLSQDRAFQAMRQVRADGQQVVAGVSTTRYTGSLAPAAALKYLPASSRRVLAPVLNEIQGDIKVTLWVSASDQVRKFAEVETVSGETVTTAVTYTSVNQPVHIALPPASQVEIPPSSVLNGTTA